MNKENLYIIGSDLYSISNQDKVKILSAICECMGTCNKYTLQELRKVCLEIKTKYNAIECDYVEIPDNQFGYYEDGTELPF